MKTVLLALVAGGFAAGCVTTPNHLEYFEPDEPTLFAGMASDNNNLVRIRVKRKDTGQWVTLAQFYPESQVYNAGGETWYKWQRNITLTSRPEWRCFFRSDCTAPRFILSADFQVIEPGGDVTPFRTRTAEEEACMTPLILDIGFLEAYEQCAQVREHLTLRWDNRPSIGGGGVVAY